MYIHCPGMIMYIGWVITVCVFMLCMNVYTCTQCISYATDRECFDVGNFRGLINHC